MQEYKLFYHNGSSCHDEAVYDDGVSEFIFFKIVFLKKLKTASALKRVMPEKTKTAPISGTRFAIR